MDWCSSLPGGTRPIMPEWEITATTVRCETVNDEVTILVAGDKTVTCTGRARYGTAGRRKAGTPRCEEGTCVLMKETIARFTA